MSDLARIGVVIFCFLILFIFGFWSGIADQNNDPEQRELDDEEQMEYLKKWREEHDDTESNK